MAKWFDDPQQILDSTKLVDRFLDYVKIHTQSDETNPNCPSTERQMTFARKLADDLKTLGIEDAAVDQHGYVYGTFPGRAEGPTIGLLAHMDTAPAYSGENVNPRLHENYDGGPLKLENDIVIDPSDNPELAKCKGDTIITADGTTLLGADDKAGVAEIFAALEFLLANPDIPCPTLRIGFTPDEEIGRGADKFDIEAFGAEAAYTLDGGFTGEVNSETFSADKGVVTIEGVSVHPGYAKGKMVNAMDWAGVFLARLPQEETPQCTDERVGFFHPTDMNGDAGKMTINLIIREFDDKMLAERGERLRAIVAEIAQEEPRLKIDCQIIAQYRNMAHGLSSKPVVFENAAEAIRKAGLEPAHNPIRGGTDGSRLTAMGLPTPNLFAGGVNFHGPQEWVSTKAMGYAVCVVLNLVQLAVKA